MRLSNLEWLAPSGEVISLNGLSSGVVLTDPPEGLIMPPPLFVSAAVFNRPGQTLEQTSFDVRTITVHLALLADTLDDFTTIASYLASLLNPRAGLGALRVTRDDGSARIIMCAYSGGLEGAVAIGDDSNTDIWAEADVTFTAFDPYFLDAAPNISTFRAQGSAPWFPLRLGDHGDGKHGLILAASVLFGNATISNAGDDLAWPIWTIRGPCTNPLLTNLTTGKVIDFSANGGVTLVDSTQTLVIDTINGTATVFQSSGAVNVWPSITAASDLWPLIGGDNVFAFGVGGASGETAVTLEYQLRWLTI